LSLTEKKGSWCFLCPVSGITFNANMHFLFT
jgi:hypothetical protein